MVRSVMNLNFVYSAEEILTENISFISSQLNSREYPSDAGLQGQLIDGPGTTQLNSNSHAQSVKALLHDHPVTPRKYLQYQSNHL